MTDAEQPSPMARPAGTAGLRAADADREAIADRLRVAAGEGRIDRAELDGWGARVGSSSTNTAHISNKAAETADPAAPTVTGHPRSGYIKVKQRHRGR